MPSKIGMKRPILQIWPIREPVREFCRLELISISLRLLKKRRELFMTEVLNGPKKRGNVREMKWDYKKRGQNITHLKKRESKKLQLPKQQRKQRRRQRRKLQGQLKMKLKKRRKQQRKKQPRKQQRKHPCLSILLANMPKRITSVKI